MAASMGGRVAVLVSGSGTNLQVLLDDPAIRPHIVLVLSDRPGVRALERADEAAIETLVIEPAGDRAALSAAVADALTERGVDVIVSAGYLRVLGSPVVERWRDRWLNVHPALLPSFPGTHAVADALAAGVKVTGVTVHLVDAGVDTGPVVLQEAIAIRPDDDWDSLEPRVHEVEHRLLPRAVRALLEDRLVIHDRVVEIREDP
jgi:formyltetrahydrofolate-dependent phosphoribosylglycinamide formyltransferase